MEHFNMSNKLQYFKNHCLCILIVLVSSIVPIIKSNMKGKYRGIFGLNIFT